MLENALKCSKNEQCAKMSRWQVQACSWCVPKVKTKLWKLLEEVQRNATYYPKLLQKFNIFRHKSSLKNIAYSAWGHAHTIFAPLEGIGRRGHYVVWLQYIGRVLLSSSNVVIKIYTTCWERLTANGFSKEEELLKYKRERTNKQITRAL